MSAIAGIYHLNQQPVSSQNSTGMMDNLSQFPADDVKLWQKENVFLGCHAQWITPESIGEALPYYDAERQLAITADAIIDNRAELFESLQVDKAKRKGMPDSQLILFAYCKWGEDAPKYLIGDFAFMIWDEREQKLFGARDFSGMRTLYYYKSRDHVAFCTTIEPLLELPFIEKKLNEAWLAEYLSITVVVDTADPFLTPYQMIQEVPPSHSITVEKGAVRFTRYCSLTSGKKLNYRSNQDYVEAFQEVYQQAIDARLRTHRQVGAQLSGGLDSGSVVSFARKTLKKHNKQLHTFSYIPEDGFEDQTPKYLIADERPYIRSTVQYVGGIKDYYLNFAGKSPYSEIDDLLKTMEMPYKFFENSFWLKGMFEEMKAHDIGVLLSGDRGNLTVSWGNALEYYAKLFRKMRWYKLMQEVTQLTKNTGGSRRKKLSVIRKHAYRSHEKETYQLPKVINSAFAMRTDVYAKLEKYGIDQSGWYAMEKASDMRLKHFEELFHWNATGTLSTKLSLKHGLWKRDPTNDLRVVRFCLSLPEEQFVQNGYDRSLIRRSTANMLPDKVRLNQRIRGVQGADWVYRTVPVWDEFIAEVECLAKDATMLEFLNESAIKEGLELIKKGPQQELDDNPHYRILMRSLIVYRFIKQFS